MIPALLFTPCACAPSSSHRRGDPFPRERGRMRAVRPAGNSCLPITHRRGLVEDAAMVRLRGPHSTPLGSAKRPGLGDLPSYGDDSVERGASWLRVSCKRVIGGMRITI